MSPRYRAGGGARNPTDNGLPSGRGPPRYRLTLRQPRWQIANMVYEPLTIAEATRLVRRLASVDAPIRVSSHAAQRMAARRIGFDEVLRTLHHGEVVRPAYRRRDAWRYRVEHRQLCVVIEFDGETVVIVVTTFERVKP